MTILLLTASLLLGHVDTEPQLDTRREAEPAISIVDALLLEVTEQTVTTGEPMDAETNPSHDPLRSRGPCDDELYLADGVATL